MFLFASLYASRHHACDCQYLQLQLHRHPSLVLPPIQSPVPPVPLQDPIQRSLAETPSPQAHRTHASQNQATRAPPQPSPTFVSHGQDIQHNSLPILRLSEPLLVTRCMVQSSPSHSQDRSPAVAPAALPVSPSTAFRSHRVHSHRQQFDVQLEMQRLGQHLHLPMAPPLTPRQLQHPHLTQPMPPEPHPSPAAAVAGPNEVLVFPGLLALEYPVLAPGTD